MKPDFFIDWHCIKEANDKLRMIIKIIDIPRLCFILLWFPFLLMNQMKLS